MMSKYVKLAAIVAVLSTPALAIDNTQPNAEIVTAAVSSDILAPENYQARTALWKSYGRNQTPDQILSNYSADYSSDGVVVEEIKSVYVIGRGITLTD
jgi:hypothetical protein